MTVREKVGLCALLYLSAAIACKRSSSSDDPSASSAKEAWAEKAFEDAEKHAGKAKKACEERFKSCRFEGGSNGEKDASMTFEAVLDASTAAKFGAKEPKLTLNLAIEKHASYGEALAASKTKDDACFVARSVLGKPYTVSISCSGGLARACCDKEFKETLHVMLLDLAPLY